MKCQCGAGYCPDDNVTYPCVCEESVNLPSFTPSFCYKVEEDVILDEEEDDLPF